MDFTSLSTVFWLIGMLAASAISSVASASVLQPAEAIDCAHQYWAERLNTNVIAAEGNTKVAWSRWYPSLTGNAAIQKELLLSPQVTQTSNSFVLSETVFDLSRSYTIDQREAEVKSSLDDLEDQVLTILQSTITSYFSSATGAIQQSIYTRRIERLKNFLDVVKELARLRISDRASAYNLEVELAQTQSDLLQLQASLKNTLSQLLGYLGESKMKDLELQTTYSLPKDLKIDPAKVSSQLPVVQNLHVQNNALLLNAKSVRAGFVPTLSFQATYAPTTLNYSSAAAISPDGLTTLGGYNPSSLAIAGLLTWNIFDQGVRSIQSAQYEAQANTAESLSQAKAKQNEVMVRGLSQQYDLNLQSLQLTNERYQHATDAFESAMTLFRLGKISYLLVKDSETSLFAAELEQKRLELQAAAINYELGLYKTYEHGRYRRLSPKVAMCKIDNSAMP